jgi:hypothetical protein
MGFFNFLTEADMGINFVDHENLECEREHLEYIEKRKKEAFEDYMKEVDRHNECLQRIKRYERELYANASIK